MLDANPGYGKLWATVTHLLASGLDTADFRAWHDDRAADIRELVERLAHSSTDVAEFVNTYSDSLAERLFALISAGKCDTALEAAADFLEGLARQTQGYAGPEAEGLPAVAANNNDPELPGVSVPPEYSMAA